MEAKREKEKMKKELQRTLSVFLPQLSSAAQRIAAALSFTPVGLAVHLKTTRVYIYIKK